ncbi:MULTISPECIES: response regulator [unclassified Leeuwenhoekiella]|uniref:response regulator n=1 Tax=unclassified Leeuwenhoekiella TaxID=2615029 RepID=UPI000C60D773|nr:MULTISPECIES: response regulator [unclassified Leeuwenhoekiella]MAW95584.1 response regulator [Leeuwenhoekiella sp.]MBA82324.1 response regulator [Leeuwenhoekiella sp.]|tara:strand:- start:11072 stop:11482 length:411 start_codon:yes stop_codon:yes gene_type:complete
MRSNYILAVEDDENDITLMKRIFQKQMPDYSIKYISDGEEALEYLRSTKFREEPPRLILLDIKIPKVSGLELLKSIRLMDEYKSIPVVMLSSSDREDEIQLSYHLGANSYIEKPKTFTDLCKTLPAMMDYWIVYNR